MMVSAFLLNAVFTGVFYDANTLFDPLFDTSGLIFVPEPGTGALLALGMATLTLWRAPAARRAAPPRA